MPFPVTSCPPFPFSYFPILLLRILLLSFPILLLLPTLRRHYGPPPKPIATSAFELILAENIAYLADDEDRRAALATLRRTIGTSPLRIARASMDQLRRVTSAGIMADRFARKLQECGRIVVEEFEGDLEQVLKLPTAAAIKALRKFPGIGLPGAEKILLFAARQPLLAPESNGLRVLVRLGLVPDRRSYSATYAAARPLAAGLGDWRSVSEAHRLLRLHGQRCCKRTRPTCSVCPLRAGCPSAIVK
jgi:endonuclease III